MKKYLKTNWERSDTRCIDFMVLRGFHLKAPFHRIKEKGISNMKKTSYPLTIFLSTLSTVLPFLSVGYVIYKAVTTGFALDDLPFQYWLLLIVSFTQWVVFRQPLKNMYQKAIQDNEYDEFGRSKKKSFANLTRKEREELDMQKTVQLEQLLSTSVLKKITKKGSDKPEQDLENLVGLNAVKQKIKEMTARMKFESKNKAYGINGRHFVFYGSAGTGKTTVARIVTGFLYEYGYIKKNKCIEIDGNFLKAGEYTDTKTKLLCQCAYGGVLFIDEAYTILDGDTGYGRSAVATLIKEMEDNRNKFTVILAGYENDMRRLLNSNEGFKSRIKEYIRFSDYSIEEMKDIFQSMAHQSGFVVSEQALNNFEIRCDKEKRLSSFGNGRTVRNILDESIDHHALNFGNGKLDKEQKYVLCGCDVSTVINKSAF